jgi:4-amino-4-deoxy-L-arabinose transferase-like glycosyltransferase
MSRSFANTEAGAPVPTVLRQRVLLVTALLLVFTVELICVARVYSANWDEAHHLYDGYSIWTRHDYRLNAEVPPLVKLTAALPLLPMRLSVPDNQGRSQNMEAFLDGRAFVFGNGGDRVLFPARMACMIFTLLLAILLYAATREMFGDIAALAALALFIFDPTVLAHGTLVSTDIGSACFIFGTVYAFYRYTKSPSPMRLFIAGLAMGFAMCAKFTGIFAFPMLLLLSTIDGLRARNMALLGRRLAACAIILVCAWGVTWAFYGFRYAAAPAGLELSPKLAPYIASMPNKTNAAELAAISRWHLLPEAYIWGLANTKKTEWEFTSYFFGRMYRHGPWQYFPAAFLIKSTLPLLVLLGLLPLLWFGKEDRHWRRLYFLLTPAVFYFVLVTASHMDIGARHLMPIYPFLYSLAGVSVARAFIRGRVWAAVAAVLLLWQVGTSLRSAPAYMAYGNEAWGGPSEVHRYLSDSNVDWGQQLKSVKQYLDQNHITNCWFAYFPDGAVEPSDYGVQCKRLPTGSSLWWLKLPMDVPSVIDGTVLISDSDLQGIESGDGPLNWFEPFRGLKPVATIQNGVYVYQGQFSVPLMSALVDVRKTGELANTGNSAAALEEAKEAVALAPESAITQLNLADTLASQEQWSEAIIHYRQASELARTIRPELQEEDLLPRSNAGIELAQRHLQHQ